MVVVPQCLGMACAYVIVWVWLCCKYDWVWFACVHCGCGSCVCGRGLCWELAAPCWFQCLHLYRERLYLCQRDSVLSNQTLRDNHMTVC